MLGRVALIGLILFGASPLLAAISAALPGLSWVGAGLDGWFALQCHRDAARSFGVLGHALPVCSRCFGIYSGLALGAVLGCGARRTGFSPHPRGTWLWTLFAAAAMLIDVASEALGLRPPWAALRFMTGLALVLPLALLLGAVLSRPARCAAGPDLQHSE